MGEIASTVIKARGLQVHAAGVLAGFSGLRVGEIAGLLWSDLDLDARLRHRQPHRRGGRRRHAPRVPAEERQGSHRAAARRRLRRAARLALSPEGVPPGSGAGLERGGEGGPQEGRQPDGALDPEEPVVELGGPPEDRPAPADPRPRDSFGTWVYETYGVKQAQEWLGHSDPATTLRHYVRLTTAARAKAVAGLDEVTRAALESAEEKILEDAEPLARQRRRARQPASVALPSARPSRGILLHDRTGRALFVSK